MTITATLPENIAPQTGEEIQFQALVQADGTFLITRVIHRELVTQLKSKSSTLGDWARQWAGAMKLEPGQTYEDLKRAAYQKKFGL